MPLAPDHRALRVAETKDATDTTEGEYLKVLKDETASEDVHYAADIYADTYKSEVLEAFLLARASNADIEKILRVPGKVTAIYRHLFFDLDSFRDELDIESYARTYDVDPFGKDLKICAITLGLEYLVYRFNRGQASEVNLVDSLRTMIETGYMLSKATRLNPLDSNAAREARQWMTAAIKGSESYIRVKPALEEYSDEFKIALEKIDNTTNERLNPNIDKDSIVH